MTKDSSECDSISSDRDKLAAIFARRWTAPARQANASWKKAKRVIDSYTDPGRVGELLRPLLLDENPAVVFDAAAFLLEFDRAHAVEALREIASGPPSQFSILAETLI